MNFTMPPDLNEVERVVEQIAVSLETATDELRLCLTEALNNAVVHGTVGNETRDIHIAVSLHADHVSIRITDHRRALSAPLLNSDMADHSSESGRGLPIIMALSPDTKIIDGDLVMGFPTSTSTKDQ
jgi:anti-sigma regulatory factor (Ser/Thr protein kinase)